MSRFNFVNPGSAAVGELQRILAEREVLKRQKFLDSITSRKMDLDEKQESRAADHQKRSFDDLALTRESQRVDRMNEDAMPGDIQTPESAALYQKHRPGAVRSSGNGIAAEARLVTPTTTDVDLQSDVTPEQMAEIDGALTGSIDDLKRKEVQSSVAPGIVVHRGGTKFLSDQAARADRAEQAQALAAQNAAAREDTASRDRASREGIAAIAAAARESANGQRRGAQDDARIDARVNSRVARFDNSAAAKSFELVSANADRVKDIDINLSGAQGASQDAMLIYTFAKTMDPLSSVREGEYDTVQAWAQAVLPKYGFQLQRILSPSQMLTPEARKAIKGEIDKAYKAQRARYNKGVQILGADLKRIGGPNQQNWRDEAGDDDISPSDASVPMVAPDGRKLVVPADKVADMESRGAKRVQ